jgi:hypothetical protein
MAAVWAAATFVEDTQMSNGIRDQFVRDMQVAGLAAGTQAQYLSSVDLFFKAAWLSPETVTEQDVQTFLIGLRERDVARETFRGYRFALECFFVNTLGRDWPLFTKKNCVPRPSSVCRRR